MILTAITAKATGNNFVAVAKLTCDKCYRFVCGPANECPVTMGSVTMGHNIIY